MLYKDGYYEFILCKLLVINCIGSKHTDRHTYIVDKFSLYKLGIPCHNFPLVAYKASSPFPDKGIYHLTLYWESMSLQIYDTCTSHHACWLDNTTTKIAKLKPL